MGTTLIAESKVYAKRGRAARVPVAIRVAKPVRARDGKYFTARVHFRGLSEPRDAYGEDSMQAAALAFFFVRIQLLALRDSGWAFYLDRRARKPADLLQFWFPPVTTQKRSNKSLERTRDR
jgi:hypothetical protein